MKNHLPAASVLLALLSGPAAQAQYWLPRDIGNHSVSRGVLDFDMPAANVIWGINYDGTDTARVVQEVFVSSNGGVTWRPNNIITDSSAGKTLTNISAIDGATAYVGAYDADLGSGYLFKT